MKRFEVCADRYVTLLDEMAERIPSSNHTEIEVVRRGSEEIAIGDLVLAVNGAANGRDDVLKL